MYDIERINVFIRNIEKYFADLRKIGLNKDNLENDEKYYSTSMIMFSILNHAVDLAGEIIVKNDFGMPSNYEQYFQLLGDKGILDKKTAETCRKLAKYRNFFAHHYNDADRKEVLEVLKNIYDVQIFVDRIKKVVEKSKKIKE